MASLDKVALALSDPIRLQILDQLTAGRHSACCSPENPAEPVALCSCDLLPTLELAPSRLSYHVKELREAGLVTEQKRGRWIYLTLNRSALVEFIYSLQERFAAEPTDRSCCAVTSGQGRPAEPAKS